MRANDIQLKGLNAEQIDRLLPQGLISLCWRGSVAHGSNWKSSWFRLALTRIHAMQATH